VHAPDCIACFGISAHAPPEWRPVADAGRYAAIPFALLLCVIALPSLAAEDVISRIEGRYESHNEYCSYMEEPGTLVPCDAGPTDSLLIERISATRARFHVYSVQVNGHQCEIEGVADLVGNELIYRDPDTTTPGQGMRIHFTGAEITFSYLKPVTGLGYCGARAFLERITFPKSSKRATPDDIRDKSL
jgi:hypothetical protein